VDLYPSHSGKQVPLHEMSEWHLAGAIKKLQAEEVRLSRMIAGLDKVGAKEFKAQVGSLCPVFTPSEALERTRHWLSLLENEQKKRDDFKWNINEKNI
jgi:hypothetical protein